MYTKIGHKSHDNNMGSSYIIVFGQYETQCTYIKNIQMCSVNWRLCTSILKRVLNILQKKSL